MHCQAGSFPSPTHRSRFGEGLRFSILLWRAHRRQVCMVLSSRFVFVWLVIEIEPCSAERYPTADRYSTKRVARTPARVCSPPDLPPCNSKPNERDSFLQPAGPVKPMAMTMTMLNSVSVIAAQKLRITKVRPAPIHHHANYSKRFRVLYSRNTGRPQTTCVYVKVSPMKFAAVCTCICAPSLLY